MSKCIIPDWPAPPLIRAVSTDKSTGNLASHVGDDLLKVLQNRKRLEKNLMLNEPIKWLNQCHSAIVLDYDQPVIDFTADACYTARSETVCAVLTGDCLPILLCDTQGTWVAAVHAGWRGLLRAVLLNTLEKAPTGVSLIAWLGPAISVHQYEVGMEVREAFLKIDRAYESAFHAQMVPQKFLLDLYEVARIQLQRKSVAVFGGEYCTYSDQRFYSYRREGQTGRQATMIWKIKNENA